MQIDGVCGRLIVVSTVVSDWWCCRAGAVKSSSAVVAGEVVPNRRAGNPSLAICYIILWDIVGGTSHTTGHARGYRGGGTPPANSIQERSQLQSAY